MRATRSGIVLGLALALLMPGSVVGQEAPAEAAAAEPDDCLTWTRHEATTLLGKRAGPAAVAASPDGTIVIVGDALTAKGTAMAWSSADGATWDAITLPGGSKYATAADVRAVEDGFVVVGTQQQPKKSAGLIWQSSDGRTWSDPVRVPSAVFTQVVTTPDGIAVAGWASKRTGQIGKPTIWTNDDGDDWVPTTTADGEPLIGGSLAVSLDGTWVYVGGELGQGRAGFAVTPRIWRLADGSAWEEVEVAKDLRDSHPPAFIGGTDTIPAGFLIATMPSDSNGGVWLSPEGAEWQRVADLPRGATSFADGPCGLLAFTHPGYDKKNRLKKGAGTVLVSEDGSTWSNTKDNAFVRAFVSDAATTPDGRVLALGVDSSGQQVWVGEPDTAPEEPSGMGTDIEQVTE